MLSMSIVWILFYFTFAYFMRNFFDQNQVYGFIIGILAGIFFAYASNGVSGRKIKHVNNSRKGVYER